MTTDQTQAVYAAEDLWGNTEPQAQIRFGDWHEIQPFYVKLAERFRDTGTLIYPPTVAPRKGSLKAHYDPDLATVHIPPYDRGGSWALNTATSLHEFAHHLEPTDGHGPKFRAAMVRCLQLLGWDHARLESCYEEVGLTANAQAEGVSDKVAKLLTHAEKAGTDEEQKVYLEKAQSLAAEHSINMALVRKRAADKNGERDRPTTGKLFDLTALKNVTHRNLAVELGCAIGRAHGVESTIRGKSSYLTFYGFPEDIHLTELMVTRVTPMMFEASDAYLKSPEHKASGVAGVSARITFCQYYAMEIGSRLKEAVQQTQQRVDEVLALGDGSMSTEIALKEKALEVKDYVAHEWKRQGVRGSWSGSSTRSWSGSAATAGAESAKRANLFGRKELS